MKKIIINNRELIFDADDFKQVQENGISIYQFKQDRFYAVNKKGKRIHRELLNIKDSKITVDHRNGNTLDNRKINLRACTQSQNTKNRSKTLKPTTSKFKGIYLNVNKKWVAQIRVNYKRICLGSFENEITAAEAYNNAAIKYFGEFALLNKL